MPTVPGKLALFLTATLLLLVTPGPAVLYIVARSMSQGPRAGLASVLGVSAYAVIAGTLGRWLWRHPRFVRGERYVSGTVYIGLGAIAALSGSGDRSGKP